MSLPSSAATEKTEKLKVGKYNNPTKEKGGNTQKVDETSDDEDNDNYLTKHLKQPPRQQRRSVRPGLQEIEDNEDYGEEQDSSNGLNASSYILRNQQHGSITTNTTTTTATTSNNTLTENNNEQQHEEENPAILDAYLAEEGNSNNRSRRSRKNKNHPEVLDAVVEPSSTSTRRKWIAPGVFCVMAAIAASIISLLIVLPQQKNKNQVSSDNDSNNNSNENGMDDGTATAIEESTVPPTSVAMTTNPSYSPTIVPSYIPTTSMAPTSERLALLLDEIQRQFDSPTLLEDLQSRSSPQYRAALWMVEEDYSDMTIGLDFPLNQTNIDLLAQFRQRYALAVFYYSTEGETWFDQCNFMNPILHVCDWNCEWPVDTNPALASYVEAGFTFGDLMGTECSSPGGYVGSIEFALNDLQGTLPEEMQGLDILVNLILSNNKIQGTIPFLAFNKTLVNRVYGVIAMGLLVLNANQLTGSIPDDIHELTSLVGLWVESNFLTGTIPSSFGDLPLWFVIAGSNLLSGTLPSNLLTEEAADEPLMQQLNFGRNLLSGSLPNEVYLPSLQLLVLDENFLSGTLPPSIANSTDLFFLRVSLNSLTGTILPESFRRLTSISTLGLYDNQFSGEGLKWEIIGGMKDMRLMSIGNNHISGTIPPELGELTNLVALDIGHSDYYDQRVFLSGTLPTELGQLQMLTMLVMSRNQLSGVLPTEIGQLSRLRQLNLNHNNFWGTIPTEFNQLTKMGTFTTHQTGLVGDLEILCSNQESSPEWRLGYYADCLEERVNCSCCTVCCDDSGYCENNY